MKTSTLEIYETKITKGAAGSIVALSIGDKPADALDRAFGIELVAIQSSEEINLLKLQRAAVEQAIDLLKELSSKISHDLLPK